MPEPPLLPGVDEGLPNLYTRDSQSGALAAVTTEPPAPILASGSEYCLTYAGATPGMGRVFFAAKGALAGEAQGEAAADGFNLYESDRSRPPSETLRLISVLPDRAPATPTKSSGFGASPSAGCALVGGPRMAGAVSEDGERLYWSGPAPAGGSALYLRANPAAPESARVHGAATGTGDTVGEATGTGTVTKFTKTVKGVKLTGAAAPEVGQPISDAHAYIPAGATVATVTVESEEEGKKTYKLTFAASGSASESLAGDELTLAGSPTVSNLATASGAFEEGQELAGPAIAPGTTILSCAPACGAAATALTLSAPATASAVASPLAATSPCTEAATKACTISLGAGSSYWGASEDGSRALYTNGAELRLFEATPEGAGLATSTTTIAGAVRGVLGYSAGLTTAYFLSTEAIAGAEADGAGEAPTGGQNNLYAWREGKGVRFIAALAEGTADSTDWSPDPTSQSARASASGEQLAFLSARGLTGYDNLQAAPGDCSPTFGGRCREAYLYDYGANSLRCASCNPSGERPAGEASLPASKTSLAQPRYLSDDGARLFFESADALSPRDTNEKSDVYEYERPGTGGCTEAGYAYSPEAAACVYPISSGQSADASYLLDASSNGRDVFLGTREALYPGDEDELFDVYDARAGGGFPFQAPSPPPAPEAGRGAATSPGLLPGAGTAAFAGPGNQAARRPRCPKGRRRVHRHGKVPLREAAPRKAPRQQAPPKAAPQRRAGR